MGSPPQPAQPPEAVLFDLIAPGPSPALLCPEDGLSLSQQDVAAPVLEGRAVREEEFNPWQLGSVL